LDFEIHTEPYQDVFGLVWKLELEVASSRQHSLDGSHPIIIVELGGQLLRAQAIGGDDLDGQHTGDEETKGVERDLGYHGVVWHHHGYSAEQYLNKREKRKKTL
jgi:hypothetical protein